MLFLTVLTFFDYMQFLCSIVLPTVYTCLFIFILLVQPMKIFHNSKCLQDNTEVLKDLFQFQKQLRKSNQVNCVRSLEMCGLCSGFGGTREQRLCSRNSNAVWICIVPSLQPCTYSADFGAL